MWGGRPDRNMVSSQVGLPAQWDVSKGTNVRWTATLGSHTFGNPAVNGGKILIGTNNEAKRNPRIEGDRSVLLCFAESDGKFLWQAAHDKLQAGQAQDWPDIGICSTPCIMGDRVYYVSNRDELVCLDMEGFYDGENDGPIRDEKFHDPTDADFVWILDMIKVLGVVPHNASASSPLVIDNLVLVITGNGIDEDHEKVPAPDTPSFVAVDRNTGKVIWADKSPGANILDGQWSSPAAGRVNGANQVAFPGGDGWLYAFDPQTGKPLWKFDCNAGQSRRASVGQQPNQLVATPAYFDNKVFLAVGQDPENGDGEGCLWAIDATKTGDVTGSAGVWHIGGKDFGRSLSTVAICDGLLYAAELTGFLHCLEVATGRSIWRYDLKSPVWGSPFVADGKVYIGNQDGDVSVFRHGRQAELLATNSMNDTLNGTPVAANGVLYVAARTKLYAIAAQATNPATLPAALPTIPATSSDWPMFRGNPQLTGVASGNLPTDLQLSWKFQTSDAVESSAAIVGKAVYFGCNDGFLYALDLSAGTLMWKYKAQAGIRSSPTFHKQSVFFGDDEGIFHAVDADSGKVRWTFRTEGEIISSANISGERVVFGSYDAFLYCLNERDGSLIWKFETQGRVHGTPGIVGDRVLVAGCDEQLHVVGLSDGRAAGEVGMGSYSGASAAISGPHVFVGTFNNQVIAVDWAKNQIAWTYEDQERQFPFYSSAAAIDDLVVIGGRDKLVHALDPKTGRVRWTFATRGRVDASPVIVGDRVFVGSMDGTLYALDETTGKEVWRYDTGSAFLASPAVARGRLIIGSDDGLVYCFGRK